MDYTVELIFGFLWVLILYHHAIYPIFLRVLLKRINEKEVMNEEQIDKATEALQEDKAKSLCILVPAYNEADVIADKIRNVASLNYPVEKVSLVIACDGCKDNTAEIARKTASEPEMADLQIHIINLKQNHGKVALLNQLIPDLDAEIIALSDASALISNDALQIANRHFDQEKVGIVAATYRLLNPGSKGEEKYWEYQVSIKQGEAAIGAPIGVHGALYFVRKHLFTPLAPDTINDDFFIPMQIVSHGYKAVYDDRLIALELEQASLGMDQSRRIRIAAGNTQQLLRLPQLMSPKLRGTAFSYVSGKALRTLMPFIFLVQFCLCLNLSINSEWFLLFSMTQFVTIILARLSLRFSQNRFFNAKGWLPLKLSFYLINGYISSFSGSLHYLLGRYKGHWKSVAKS